MSNVPSKEEMIRVTEYVEVQNEDKKYWLGIGKIDHSQDIYIELYHIINVPSSDKNRGTVKREKIISKRFEYGQYLVSKNESIHIRERYIEMLRKQCEDSFIVKKSLMPLVKDFECIVGKKKQRAMLMEL